MAKTMPLPKIGVNMTEAVLSAWLIKEGDRIHAGDVILTAETDKATQDIYATESGIVETLLALAGDTVKINEPILIFADEGETRAESIIEKGINDSKHTGQGAKDITDSFPFERKLKANTKLEGRVKSSPLARKVAKGMNLDIAQIAPTENGLRIVKEDVLRFSALKQLKKARLGGDVLEVIPLRGARSVIAERMLKSTLEQPSAALTLNVDASGMIELREKFKARDKRIGFTEIIMKACAVALENHRILNSRLTDGGIEVLADINIGIAMDTERGLMVPVIKQVNKKTLVDLSESLATKTHAAKTNRLSHEDMDGGTFTISNLGMYGIINFTAIINPPECAILAVGMIQRIVVPDDMDNLVIKPVMSLTLSFDHRIVDGAPAARFLNDVKQYLENPVTML